METGIQEVGLCQRSSQGPAAGGAGGGFLAAVARMEIPAVVLDSHTSHTETFPPGDRSSGRSTVQRLAGSRRYSVHSLGG